MSLEHGEFPCILCIARGVESFDSIRVIRDAFMNTSPGEGGRRGVSMWCMGESGDYNKV